MSEDLGNKAESVFRARVAKAWSRKRKGGVYVSLALADAESLLAMIDRQRQIVWLAAQKGESLQVDLLRRILDGGDVVLFQALDEARALLAHYDQMRTAGEKQLAEEGGGDE